MKNIETLRMYRTPGELYLKTRMAQRNILAKKGHPIVR